MRRIKAADLQVHRFQPPTVIDPRHHAWQHRWDVRTSRGSRARGRAESDVDLAVQERPLGAPPPRSERPCAPEDSSDAFTGP